MILPDYIQRALRCGKFPPMRDWRNTPLQDCTRAEKNMKFIEKYFKVPEGDLVGQPMKLTLFQEVFFYCVFDAPRKIRRVIFSIARKNAKTALIAIIVILYICGQEAIQNSRLASAAQTRDQASEVFNYASKIIEQSPELSTFAKVVASRKMIFGITSKVQYKALSSDAKSNIGGSPLVAVIDEAGQIEGERDALVEAILTGQLAYENALHFIISTQAATDGDWLSIQIDDAINNQPDDVICFVYEADAECDLLDEIQWKNANPALDDFCSRENLRNLLSEAQRMPSLEASRRNLNLNQRVNRNNPFIPPVVFKACGKPANIQYGDKIYAGLDLSTAVDLSALVFIANKNNNWHVEGRYFLPKDTLKEKSRQDRVPYDVWEKQGFIVATNGKVIDYDFIAQEIWNLFHYYDLQVLGFDRYKISYLKPKLIDLGFTDEMLDKIQPFGQGFVSMSPAIQELEADFIQGRIAHGNNPVLSMAAQNATVLSDSTGNRKLVKPKQRYKRIDPMVALVMARGVVTTELTKEQAQPDYSGGILFV